MRSLHDQASSNPDADLAVRSFCSSVRKQIAAMVAVLEGIDLVVFTGAAICRGLAWIGLDFDDNRNRSATNPISETHARCAVQVLPSQEDEQIARHAATIAAAQS